MPQKSNIVGGQPVPGTPATAGYEQVVDGTFGASRVAIKPDDHVFGGVARGHYRVAAPSGLTTGLASGSLLFSFRYGDPTSVAVLKKIHVYGSVTTAFTTGQPVDIDAITVRGWTASDTAGTPILLGSNTNKLRGNMAPSTIAISGDIRVATAAAIAAGATKTPDVNPFAIAAVVGGSALGVAGFADLYKLDSFGAHPPVFAANEGFNLRLVTAQGAAGVVKYYIDVEWAELAGF
jgi:hypothetical protein